MTTQREIARLAKTSLKTVSRVINKDPLVNEDTRSRIEKIIGEVGYTPNKAARMMRSQRSNIIGFLAHQVATTSSSIELVHGAQDVAWERGKQMMLINLQHGNASEALAHTQLAEFRAEAIIYAAVFHQQIAIEPGEVPYVLLNCFEETGKIATILPDDYQLGYDLSAELIRRGYRNPVFLNLDNALPASRLRAQGFEEAARAQGLDFSGCVHVAAAPPPQFQIYSVDRLLPQLFGGTGRPDVVVCGQDLMAIPVYFQLSALGLTPGKDIAVASFDNFEPVARLLQPGLSTMELPYYEMGRAAMNAAIDGIEAEPRVLVRGSFVSRDSM